MLRQQINFYIDLVMEHHKAIIYVAEKRFYQCSFLVADLTQRQAEEIDSIDKLATVDGARSLEGEQEAQILADEEILFGHASNLIAWCENGYDTRILHSNLSFPLLKALAREGDAKAKRVLQGEIIDRLRADFEATSLAILETCGDIMDEEAINIASRSISMLVRRTVCNNAKNIQDSTLARLAKDLDGLVRNGVARHEKTAPSTLALLSHDTDFNVRYFVAENVNTPTKTLLELAGNSEAKIRGQVARNSKTSPSTLAMLATDNSSLVTSGIATNPHTPPSILAIMAEDQERHIRVLIAENEKTPVETLRKLAEDKEDTVRNMVAGNKMIPRDILKILAQDKDDFVKEVARYNLKYPRM